MSAADDKIKLDDIDLRILAILQKNGRITNAKLAAQIGLSAPPMLERVKKLERQGVIRGYGAILNAQFLKRDFLVFVALNLDVSALKSVVIFEQAINAMGEVMECHHIAGDIDFLLKIRVQDQEHYKQFVCDQLSQIKGISRLVSWVALSSNKDSWELMVPEPKNAK